MLPRHAISDAAWERIQDLLPGRPGQPGWLAKDNRLFVDAILWIAKTGVPWRDLPERFGKWNTVWKAAAPVACITFITASDSGNCVIIEQNKLLGGGFIQGTGEKSCDSRISGNASGFLVVRCMRMLNYIRTRRHRWSSRRTRLLLRNKCAPTAWPRSGCGPAA